MPLDPTVYAKMLGEKIEKHNVNVWLLNTGWTGGPYGVGERMSIKHTRAMLHAALDGKFDDVKYSVDPIFGLSVPATCPNVPDEVLDPKSTWSDKAAYDAKAKGLAKSFHKAFAPYAENIDAAVAEKGGPRV